MATSAVAFSGVVSFNNELSQTMTVTFTPPSNLEGKLCYAQVTVFQLLFGLESTTPSNGWKVDCDWPQVQCSTDTHTSGHKASCPLAIWHTGYGSLQSHPVLISMPQGRHNVTFTFSPINVDNFITDAIDVLLCLSIVPASSRQTPLG